MKIIDALLDAVFPRRCVLCRQVLETKEESGLCALCRWEDYRCPNPETERGRSSLIYEDRLQQAIYRLKYEGMKDYAACMAHWMMEEGGRWAAEKHFDCLTAVPLAEKRMKSRGYNQAEEIARALSRLCRVPYRNLLVRVQETRPQSGLGEMMRRQNVAQAFETAEAEIVPRRICLIDDIMTTGSTLEACMQTLNNRWPDAEIWYWVLTVRESEQISANFLQGTLDNLTGV